VDVEFLNAGHLLGSATNDNRRQDDAVRGDLGRYNRPVLPDPVPVAEADVLLLESTYGDRLHEPDDGGARLAAIINETVQRGGRVIIPSFAVGRVEELLYWLRLLERSRRIPTLPVYVDSPMAAGALQFYTQRCNELDPEMKSSERDACVFGTERMTIVLRRGIDGLVVQGAGHRDRGERDTGDVLHTWRPVCRSRTTRCCLSDTSPRARADVSCATASST
jgi:metallo-beta-lactamase family protein